MSKLMQVFAVRELAAEVASRSSNVIINCLTPGACHSDFDRESTGIGRLMMIIMTAIVARYADSC